MTTPVDDVPAHPHVSAYALDGLREGRLARARAEEVEQHLGVCAACRAREHELRAHQQRFVDEVLPRTRAQLHARAQQGAGADARRWRWVGLFALAPVAALVLLLVGPRPPGAGNSAVNGNYTGEKGAAAGSLRIVARRNGHVFVVKDGSVMAAGDSIRFAVTVGHPWLMIASVDGRGETKIYVPFEGSQSAPVEPGSRLELPKDASIELDAAPGPERIFALGSRAPLSAAAVLAALKQLAGKGPEALRTTGRLGVDADEQLTVVLEKMKP